jgi:hypothetical protein
VAGSSSTLITRPQSSELADQEVLLLQIVQLNRRIVADFGSALGIRFVFDEFDIGKCRAERSSMAL